MVNAQTIHLAMYIIPALPVVAFVILAVLANNDAKRYRQYMSAHIQTVLRELAKEAMGPTKLKINAIVRHPTDGIVKIVDGQYWAAGGFSNFWTWRSYNSDGTLGEPKSGYGWMQMALNFRIEMRMRTDGNHKLITTFYGYNDNNTVTEVILDRLGGVYKEKIKTLVAEAYQRGSRLIYVVQYLDDVQQGEAQMVLGPWGATGDTTLQIGTTF